MGLSNALARVTHEGPLICARDAWQFDTLVSMKTPSTEPILRSRLLPQISFRFLLFITALSAMVLTLGRFAGNGGTIARAMLVGLAIPVAVIAMGAISFLLSWVVASLTLRSGEAPSRPSPFAENQLPPQTLPPRDRIS